jgi:hypothetical protein
MQLKALVRLISLLELLIEIPLLIAGQELQGIDLVVTCQGLKDFDPGLKHCVMVHIRD